MLSGYDSSKELQPPWYKSSTPCKLDVLHPYPRMVHTSTTQGTPCWPSTPAQLQQHWQNNNNNKQHINTSSKHRPSAGGRDRFALPAGTAAATQHSCLGILRELHTSTAAPYRATCHHMVQLCRTTLSTSCTPIPPHMVHTGKPLLHKYTHTTATAPTNNKNINKQRIPKHRPSLGGGKVCLACTNRTAALATSYCVPRPPTGPLLTAWERCPCLPRPCPRRCLPPGGAPRPSACCVRRRTPRGPPRGAPAASSLR